MVRKAWLKTIFLTCFFSVLDLRSSPLHVPISFIRLIFSCDVHLIALVSKKQQLLLKNDSIKSSKVHRSTLFFVFINFVQKWHADDKLNREHKHLQVLKFCEMLICRWRKTPSWCPITRCRSIRGTCSIKTYARLFESRWRLAFSCA